MVSALGVAGKTQVYCQKGSDIQDLVTEKFIRESVEYGEMLIEVIKCIWLVQLLSKGGFKNLIQQIIFCNIQFYATKFIYCMEYGYYCT